MDEVHASQPTIRRALKDLIDEGFLLADPRRGYFVRHHADVRYVGNISTAYSANSYGERPTEFAAPCREKNLVLLPYYVESTDTVSDILRMIRNKPTEERFLLNGLSMELTLELSAELQVRGYRHLLIGPPLPGFSGLSVFPDQDQEVNQILDYLTEMNHQRIVFMANESKSLTITKLRAEAVERKLKERNLSQAHLIWCQTSNWNSSFEAAYAETRELFQRKPRPTAIVPLSGIGAWAVLRYAYEHKIDVPQQLSVVSFDPIINAHVHSVPLTEMTYSMTACARMALDLLWSDLVVTPHTFLPSELVIRGSSGLAP